MSDISANDYILQQNELENQAKEIMPWSPRNCTYNMGPIRQSIFACLSCGQIGVCYSCSIQCHSSCEIVELFTKRNFSCDCGTERVKSDKLYCSLRENKIPDIPDYSNRYGQNYKGLFCDCHQKYNPDSKSIMIQCQLGIECNEDWYHDHCILGCLENCDLVDLETNLKDFPALDSFDGFICWKCVNKVSSQISRLLSCNESDKFVSAIVRHVSCTSLEERDMILDKGKSSGKRKLDDYPYSVFLKKDYSIFLKELKDTLKNDDKLFIFLNDITPYLINDDPPYEHPDDTDSESTYELGMKAFNSYVDRGLAIDGLVAFEKMKEKLTDFLKPFAKSGEVVKEEDIKNFFKSQEFK